MRKLFVCLVVALALAGCGTAGGAGLASQQPQASGYLYTDHVTIAEYIALEGDGTCRLEDTQLQNDGQVISHQQSCTWEQHGEYLTLTNANGRSFSGTITDATLTLSIANSSGQWVNVPYQSASAGDYDAAAKGIYQDDSQGPIGG